MVAGVKTLLQVEGMTCQNCARHVREALEQVPGVETAEVNLDSGQAAVRWSGEPAEEKLVRAVSEAGYAAAPAEGARAADPGAGWRWNVIIGLLITTPLLAGEWLFQLHHYRWWAWVSLFAALPVQFWCGARFYRGAWQQLRRGQSNMDTLVALGSTAAFGFSLFGLFAPDRVTHLYFAESAAIITLISLGHYLEARTAARAAGAVRALLQLAPEQARVIDAAGKESLVPVGKVRVGDRLALRPGDRAPVDGIIVDGASALDESMLTGESMPVEKSVGANVYAGTLNAGGKLVVEAGATGEQTALARIAAMVQQAQQSRAGVQRLADRISSVFVPVVVLIAAATLLAWGLANGSWERGIVNAVAVLIVACPCAMGIATPAAIMAGTNAAAKRGILIRDGVALEKSGTVTAVLFDKTGTLTRGQPSVGDVRVIDYPKDDALAIARALARSSHHPLSQAIARHAENAGEIQLENWREIRGSGVAATYRGQQVRLGSITWLEQNGIDVSSVTRDSDATLLGLSVGDHLVTQFELRDALRDGATDVVARLQRAGLHTYLVSGDRKAVAQAIGKSVGIADSNIFAEVRPEQKAELIGGLQKRGERVAFVGDGINDAPALASADLGIAVTEASDVAREAADILLLKHDVAGVPEALDLSRATLRTIRQNLFWAFFYNAAAVPLAAFGLMSPILCAAAMALSDLMVIGNALRLLQFRPNR
jgi:Cu+-exporting ATPase